MGVIGSHMNITSLAKPDQAKKQRLGPELVSCLSPQLKESKICVAVCAPTTKWTFSISASSLRPRRWNNSIESLRDSHAKPIHRDYFYRRHLCRCGGGTVGALRSS